MSTISLQLTERRHGALTTILAGFCAETIGLMACLFIGGRSGWGETHTIVTVLLGIVALLTLLTAGVMVLASWLSAIPPRDPKVSEIGRQAIDELTDPRIRRILDNAGLAHLKR